MKNLFFYLILGASLHIAHAEDMTIAPQALPSERYVYLNSNLIGYFPVCIIHASNDFFFEDSFFEQVNLLKSTSTVQCLGHLYTKPLISFVRNDVAGTLSATTTPNDFIPLSSQPSGSAVQENEARAKTVVIQASSVQHALGLSYDATGANMTLGAAGQYYSDAGMFEIDGSAASESGKTQSYISDLNWKRHFADTATNASFGLTSISAPGSAVRLYGFVLASDEDTRSNNATQSISGFAEVFGKVQVRSRGLLLKEVPVAVGNFSISMGDLPVSSGAVGQYTLDLVDDAGKIVRSWDVFVPFGARLLRPGRANWSVYTGQIESNISNNSLLGGPQNLGAGFILSYGVNPWLTADTFSVLSSHVKGTGLAVTAAPVKWMSATAGQARYAEAEKGGMTTYGGVELHTDYVGLSTNFTRLSCAAQYAGRSSATSSLAGGQCSNVNFSLYAVYDLFGRLSLQHGKNNGALSGTSSLGLSWSPPPIGNVSLSLYGSRATDTTSTTAPSTSYGFSVSLPLGRGQLVNTANYSSPNSIDVSTTYQESINTRFQYSLTADAGNSSNSSLRGTADYSPWYGNFQTYAQIGQNGQQSIGLNESGALVFARNQVLVTQQSQQGYAIVHLDKINDLALENGAGERQTVVNKHGYAALPVARGSEPNVRVAAEEMPDNINIAGELVGHISDNWQATLWEPIVRTVNKGWARLIFSKGNPVQIGATLRLKRGEEPTYVLSGGDIYFNDFPANEKHVEVILSGSAGRCFVDFPDDVQLKQSYVTDRPEFTCVTSSLD